jgi:hypothetical protein
MENSTYLLEKLDEWNSKLASDLIPNSVILSLYILAGLFGNSAVILIYTFKMRENKEDRYFIPFLAIADLWASLVCTSKGIAENMMQVTFNNTHLCKAWWFFAAFISFMSILILFIIAIHRYLKVCRPHGKQMTLKWKRSALGIALTLALIVSLPTIYFYGSVPFPNDDERIVGQRCTRLKTANKTASLIFGGIVLITAVAIIVALIFFYLRIGYTILLHFKFIKNTCKPDTSATLDAEISSKTEQSIVTIPRHKGPLQGSDNGNYPIKTTITELSESLSSQTSVNRNEKTVTTNTKCEENRKLNKSSGERIKERKNQQVVQKFTLMFMLITIIFLVCDIPKGIIMLLEASNSNFWEEFSDSTRAGVLFVYRMYLINNIANPLIYAFLDEQFAKEIKSLIKICK